MTFTVTDGTAPVSETIAIAIANTNRAPVLAPIGNKSGSEGPPDLHGGSDRRRWRSATYSASGLPLGASFDATAKTFSWTPGFDQTGTYPVTFTVTDGTAPVSETIAITIANTNRAPVLTPIGNKSGSEGVS